MSNSLLSLLILTTTLTMQPSSPPTAGVAGEWLLSIHGDHVMTSGLRLQQDGTKVTGTLFMQGREAEAEGEFIDRTLTLTVNAAIATDHSKRAGTTKLAIKVTMKDDGTLEGEMIAARGPVRVTAERFRAKS